MTEVGPLEARRIGREMKRLGQSVAFMGTHGSGKSTLAGLLGDALQIPANDGAARKAMGARILTSRQKQQFIMEAVIHPFLGSYGTTFNPPSVIATRTPLDVLAYSYTQLDTCADLIDPQERIVSQFLGQHERIHLFYVPMLSGPMEMDGVRPASPHLQRLVDLIIRGYITELTLEITDVDGDLSEPTAAERCQNVLRILQARYP